MFANQTRMTSRAILSAARRSLLQQNAKNGNSRMIIVLNEQFYSSSSLASRSMSTTMSSSLSPSSNNKNKNNNKRYDLPRIELPVHFFSTTTSSSSNSGTKEEESNATATSKMVDSETATASETSTTATTNNQTLRERMEEATGGVEAARRGASNAGDLMRQYGPVFVGTYLTVYVSTLGLTFLGVESGLLDPGNLLTMVSSTEDAAKSSVEFITDFLGKYPWTKPYAPMVARNPELANLAIAWIAVKFTEPIRLAISIPLTPRIARYFGYTKKPIEEGTTREGEGEKGNDEEKATSSAATTATKNN